MKTKSLAQMGTASCCPGVRDNRYSVQLELAPNQNQNYFGEGIKKIRLFN